MKFFAFYLAIILGASSMTISAQAKLPFQPNLPINNSGNTHLIDQDDFMQAVYNYKTLYCEDGFPGMHFTQVGGKFTAITPSACSWQVYLKAYQLVVKKIEGCPDCTKLLQVSVPLAFKAYVAEVSPINQRTKIILELPNRPPDVPGLQPQDCKSPDSRYNKGYSEPGSRPVVEPCISSRVNRTALYDHYEDGDVVDYKIVLTGLNVDWDNVENNTQTYDIQPGTELDMEGISLDLQLFKPEVATTLEQGPWDDEFDFVPVGIKKEAFSVLQKSYNPYFPININALRIYFYANKI